MALFEQRATLGHSRCPLDMDPDEVNAPLLPVVAFPSTTTTVKGCCQRPPNNQRNSCGALPASHQAARSHPSAKLCARSFVSTTVPPTQLHGPYYCLGQQNQSARLTSSGADSFQEIPLRRAPHGDLRLLHASQQHLPAPPETPPQARCAASRSSSSRRPPPWGASQTQNAELLVCPPMLPTWPPQSTICRSSDCSTVVQKRAASRGPARSNPIKHWFKISSASLIHTAQRLPTHFKTRVQALPRRTLPGASLRPSATLPCARCIHTCIRSAPRTPRCACQPVPQYHPHGKNLCDGSGGRHRPKPNALRPTSLDRESITCEPPLPSPDSGCKKYSLIALTLSSSATRSFEFRASRTSPLQASL